MRKSIRGTGKRAGVLALAVLLGTGSALNAGMTFAESSSSYIQEVRAAETGSKTVINGTTTWKYLDDDTDPAAGQTSATVWTEKAFDDNAWKSAAGKFGAKKGILQTFDGFTPTVLLNQYREDGKDIPAYFFRTTFTVEDIDKLTSITGTLYHDDAMVVYLNGTEIASVDLENNNEEYSVADREGEPNMYYAGVSGGAPKTSEINVTAEQIKSYVVEGENVLAVELHQDRPTSSDIYLEVADMTLNYGEESEEPDTTSVTQQSVILTMGSDETSRNITWYADAATAGVVQFAEKNGDEFPAEYTEAQAAAKSSNASGFYSNQATLTGLKANTEYVYRVKNGETVSETYSFKTGADGTFSFALVGDPQIGAGSAGVAVNTEEWGKTLDVIVNNLNPDFMLSAGDQVNTANSETEYTGYLNSALASLASATTVGNHDSGSAAYGEHFNLPNESATLGTTTAGGDYWFVYNNTLFMGINSNDTSTAEHKEFMQQAIAANPGVTWKTVFFHHSIYSTASHWNNSDIITRRNELPQVFDELDIDVVLMGHDHIYTRSYMMDAGTPDSSKGVQSEVFNTEYILYLTANSASGSKYYALQTAAVEKGYAAVSDQSNRRTVTDITVTDNSYTLTTYYADDMSLLDTFTIYKTDKTALEAAIDEADKLMADEDEYTTDSWTAFENAYTTATTVYADDEALQTEIDEAAKNLTDALKALEKVTTTPDEDGDDDTQDNNNNQDGTQVEDNKNNQSGSSDSDKNHAESATTTSTVETGDTTNPAAWALLMVGAAGMIILVYKRRRA